MLLVKATFPIMNLYYSAGKPPAGPVAQIKGKSGSSQGSASYPLQRQSSRVRKQTS